MKFECSKFFLVHSLVHLKPSKASSVFRFRSVFWISEEFEILDCKNSETRAFEFANFWISASPARLEIYACTCVWCCAKQCSDSKISNWNPTCKNSYESANFLSLPNSSSALDASHTLQESSRYGGIVKLRKKFGICSTISIRAGRRSILQNLINCS